MKKKDKWISLAIIGTAALTLCFYTLVRGSVKIDAGGATAVLQLHSIWLNKTTITSGAEPYPVSARVHRPQHLSVSMKQEGRTWQIESRGPWGDLSRIKIKNNQTTTLRLGPPFSIKPRISRNGSVIEIDYTIVGQAGEQYENLVRKNDRAVIGATLTIADEAGNVLHTGKFKYG